MNFSSYMQKWLYDGYYSHAPNIGKKGDFYTSVSTSEFFGGSIANYFIKLVEEKKLNLSISVVEIGSHQGYMMADFIQFLWTLRPKWFKFLAFYVVEPLENLRKVQEKYFKQCFGDKIKINIIKNIHEITENESFIMTNELFDSFLCEVIDHDKMLKIKNHEAYFDKIDEKIKHLKDKFEITKGEITLGLDNFIFDINKKFDKCLFLTFDYGQEYSRDDFSLRIYKNHQSYPFFELTNFTNYKSGILKNFYKKSDITYDINFFQVKYHFLKYNFKEHYFASQSKALVDFGLIDLLEILRQNTNETNYINKLNKAKMLILPEFFGNRFKCNIYEKGIS